MAVQLKEQGGEPETTEPSTTRDGELPEALQNTAAATYGGGVALIGGKGASGTVSSVTVLRPAA